jgi:hypothetical protein
MTGNVIDNQHIKAKANLFHLCRQQQSGPARCPHRRTGDRQTRSCVYTFEKWEGNFPSAA